LVRGEWTKKKKEVGPQKPETGKKEDFRCLERRGGKNKGKSRAGRGGGGRVVREAKKKGNRRGREGTTDEQGGKEGETTTS